jgi:hypothetical protein
MKVPLIWFLNKCEAIRIEMEFEAMLDYILAPNDIFGITPAN